MAIANSNHHSRRSNLGSSSLFAVGGTQSSTTEEQGSYSDQHQKLMMSVAAATVGTENNLNEPPLSISSGEERRRENTGSTRGGDVAAGGVQRSSSEDTSSHRGPKAASKGGKSKSPLFKQSNRKSRKSDKSSSTATMSAIERAKHALDLSRHSTASRSQTTISSITGLGESFIGRGTSVYTDPGDDEVDDADDEIQTESKDDADSKNKKDSRSTTTSSFVSKNEKGDDDDLRSNTDILKNFRSTSTSSYSKLLANMDELSVSAAANSNDTEYEGSHHNDDISSTYSSCLTPFTTGSTFANDEDNESHIEDRDRDRKGRKRQDYPIQALAGDQNDDSSPSSVLTDLWMSGDGSMSSLPHYPVATNENTAHSTATDDDDGSSMSRTISGNSVTQHVRNTTAISEFRMAQRSATALADAGHRLAGNGARTSAATGDDGTSPYTSSFNSRDTEVNRSDWAKIQLEQENCRLVLDLHRSMEKERQLSDMADLLTKQMRKTLKENDELTQGIQDLINTCETLEETKRDLQEDVDELQEENEIMRQTIRQMELQRKRERMQLQQLKMKEEEHNRERQDKSEVSQGMATREDGTELSSLTNEHEVKKRSEIPPKMDAGGKTNEDDFVQELQEQLVALAKDNSALLKERSKMLQKLRFSDLQLDDYAHQLQVLQLQQQEVERLRQLGDEEEDRPLVRSVSHDYESSTDDGEEQGKGEGYPNGVEGEEEDSRENDSVEDTDGDALHSDNKLNVLMELRDTSKDPQLVSNDAHPQLNPHEHDQYYAGDAVSMLTFDVPQCTAVEVTEDEASVDEEDEDVDVGDVERKLARRREATRHTKSIAEEKKKKSKRKNSKYDKKERKQDKPDKPRDAGDEESHNSRSESEREHEHESRSTSTGGTSSRITKPGQATTDEVQPTEGRDKTETSESESESSTDSSTSSEIRHRKSKRDEDVDDLKDELSQCKMEIMCLTQLLKQERRLQNPQAAVVAKSKKNTKTRGRAKGKPSGYNDGNQAAFFAGGGYGVASKPNAAVARRTSSRKSGCSSVVLSGTSVDEERSKQGRRESSDRRKRSSSAHSPRRHSRQGYGQSAERPPSSPSSTNRFALIRAASSVISGGGAVDPSKTVRFISNASLVSNSSLYSSLTPPSASAAGHSGVGTKVASGSAGSNGGGAGRPKDDLSWTLRGGARTSGTVRRSNPELQK